MSNTLLKNGRLVVLSAPSGCGKTTIYKQLLKDLPDLKYSISYTTRPMRPGEIDGKDYHFIDIPTFKKMIKEKKLLEWQKVYSRYYGTSRQIISDYTEKGFNVIMDIDVKGGKFLKKAAPDGIFIFIEPPSLEELERRLRDRKTDADAEIKKRLKAVAKELKYRKYYDYIVVNDCLDEAVLKIKNIIQGDPLP